MHCCGRCWKKSYRLVLGGFSKKKQRALLEGEKKDAI